MTPRMVVPPFTPGLKGSFPTKRAAKDFCGTEGPSGRAQGRTNSNTQEASHARGSSPSLLCTWVMLSTGPAGSRVSVSSTLPEGTGSSPSQGRGRCVLSASQNTHPPSGKLPAAIHLTAISAGFSAVFQSLRSPCNLDGLCSF